MRSKINADSGLGILIASLKFGIPPEINTLFDIFLLNKSSIKRANSSIPVVDENTKIKSTGSNGSSGRKHNLVKSSISFSFNFGTFGCLSISLIAINKIIPYLKYLRDTRVKYPKIEAV